MKKLLLLFISVLFFSLGAHAEVVSFSNGLPSSWKSSGTVAKQKRVNDDACLQLQKSASITSPAYSNVSSIKLTLNISGKATTLKVEQSSDNKNWATLKTILKSECDQYSWKTIEISTSGDTSNGVYFKLTSDAASYYILSFETITSGGTVTPDPEKIDPELKWITWPDTEITELSVSMKNAETVLGNIYPKNVTTNVTSAGADEIYKALTFTSRNPSVAKMNETEGFKHIPVALSAGTTTITATFAGNDTYSPAKAEFVLTITDVPATPVITFGDVTTSETGEYTVLEGTNVTISSKDATYIVYSNTTVDEDMIKGSTYSFTLTESDMYEFYGMNDDGESDHVIIDFTVTKPVGKEGMVSREVEATFNFTDLTTLSTTDNRTFEKEFSNFSDYTDEVKAEKGIAFDKQSNQYFYAVDGTLFTKNGITLSAASVEGGTGARLWSGTRGTQYRTYGGIITIAAPDTYAIQSLHFAYGNSKKIPGTTAVSGESASTWEAAEESNTVSFGSLEAGKSNLENYQITTVTVKAIEEYVIRPEVKINGVAAEAGKTYEFSKDDVLTIECNHESHALYYNTVKASAPAYRAQATTEGWTRHDSHIFESKIADIAPTEGIHTITAKAVKYLDTAESTSKESQPVSISFTNSSVTGIEGVEAEAEAAEVEWYTIEGVRVSAPAEGGLYIRRQGSKVEKVIL